MTSKIEAALFKAAGKLEKTYNKKDGGSDSDRRPGTSASSNHTQRANDALFDASERKLHNHDASPEMEGHEKQNHEHEDDQPAGGFDDTPVPKAPPGYTLKFTFHRATNLPMADINSFSSDPYIHAQLYTNLATRHKEDPPLRMRTPTIRRNTEPKWDTEWVVANVPASGFRLKCRIYDEDPADHDDRLGNVTIEVHGLDEQWPGIQKQAYKIKKRMASKRAYIMRGIAVALQKTKHMDGSLFVSVENLGRTKDEDGGRCYTVGPMWYTKHYSPMLGRLAGRKEPSADESPRCARSRRKAERYNFQANQFQMHGPVPPELYHRFVEFKPFVKRMFTSSGIEGFLLSKALHHQHARVYNFDRTTEYGVLGEEPSYESTLKFLDLVHWDEGGRIFTYVLTLDALFRFTETGKEFGIDFLSKHTMHSDVNIYIAYSGEFFIRRLKHKNRKTPEEHLHNPPDEEGQEHDQSPHTPGSRDGSHSPSHHRHQNHHSQGQTQSANLNGGQSSEHASHLRPQSPSDQTEEHPPQDISGGPPDSPAPRDPRYYELVIDNDSGTYRPNAALLPILKTYLHAQLPGLHIAALDCQDDAELQQRMKKEQREKKETEGDRIIYRQASNSSNSSISSSDLSDLDELEEAQARERGTWKALGKDAKTKGKARQRHWRILAKGRDKFGGGGDGAGDEKEKDGGVRNGANRVVDNGAGELVDHGTQPPSSPKDPLQRKEVPSRGEAARADSGKVAAAA